MTEPQNLADPCAVCSEWETQYDAAMGHVEKLRDILSRVKVMALSLAEDGLRFDLMPTMNHESTATLDAGYRDYIARMDVKARAIGARITAALSAPVPDVAAEPLTVEWALAYARRYWQHGNEPESQAALHVLADALRAESPDVAAERVAAIKEQIAQEIEAEDRRDRAAHPRHRAASRAYADCARIARAAALTSEQSEGES